MSSPNVKQRIRDSVAGLFESEVALLQRLVQFPSIRGETNGIQRFLAEYLERNVGLETQLESIDRSGIQELPGFSPVEWSYDGLVNCVAIARGASAPHRSLLLNGHVDVVPVGHLDNWKHDPWGGEVADGRLYGRGAADMKGGIAAMIFALAAVRESGLALQGDVLIETVIDEEGSGNGTLSLLQQGYLGTGALVPEPFGLSAVIAHVGVLWCRIRVRGRGAHAQAASSAINAAERAFDLVEGLRTLESEWNEPERLPAEFRALDHPVNFNLGVIRGGDWPSSVPEDCIVEMRFGFPPGLDLNSAKRSIEERVREHSSKDPWLREFPPELNWFGIQAEPAQYHTDHELFDLIAANHYNVTGQALQTTAVGASMDSRFFELYYGIPTVTYGPVGGNLHAADEWIDLESLRVCTGVLAGLIVDWCGVAATGDA